MLLSLVLLAITAWAVYTFTTKVIALRKNIALAEESGLPYVVVPVYLYWRPWMIVSAMVVDLLRKLPVALQPGWTPHVLLEQSWVQLTTQFDHAPTRTYLTVAPGGIICWAGNAEAISQITTRRNDFPKPIHIYKSLDIYGKNIVTLEGHLWRRHRKVTSPPFSEKNNHLVFAESVYQAQSMAKDWTNPEGGSVRSLSTAAHDCMRLSLHIISRAGFGVRLLWPGIETESKDTKQAPDHGHALTYTDALEGLLHNILFVVALPPALLSYLPFKRTTAAYQCFLEWKQYMIEMREKKKIEVSSGEGTAGLDLMGALVKSAGYGADAGIKKGKEDYLTDDEILGNAFVFILAGHETTANAVHFSLLFLAMELAEQRKLQKDLDSIFRGRKPSEWDYERDINRLFGGMTGAVLNETLRLIPPVVNIPKSTITWQNLEIDGKQYKVPPKTYISLCTAMAHRDPRYWPIGPPLPQGEAWHPTSNRDNDLNEFRPSRWLLADDRKGMSTPAKDEKMKDAESIGVDTAPDTAETLFRPRRGAYLPFSEGYRSCIGRRFAQVEVLAVIAVLLSEWSVELAVDEYASDEEVARMSEVEKKEIWTKVRRDARNKLRTKMGTIITIQLRAGECVPIRLVRRGTERFNFVN